MRRRDFRQSALRDANSARRQQAAVGAAVADRPRPVVQNITIQTPDAGSFRQSRGQVLAELSRSVARSNRHR